MSDKFKIAVYSGEIPSTAFIERLIKGLSNKGCQIFLFGNIKKSSSYQSENISVKGYRNNRISKAFYLLYYTVLLTLFRFKDKRRLDKILKDESRFSLYDRVKYYPVLWYKPDIFHVQWAKGINDWLWVKTFGIKIILSLRGAHINYSPIANLELAELYTTCFPKVDGFHAVSKAIAKEATKYGANAEKIKVIYSGLDISSFENVKGNASDKNDAFHVISVGRPHWIKGYTYALDAFKILLDKNIQFKYTIVGGLNLELEYQIDELGLSPYVNFIGKVPFDEAQNLIKTSDLLLLPSMKEGLANVVLEAMANSKLVLTTDCGGMNEVITHGKNGFIVPIRNTTEMANAILEISKLSNSEKQQIAANALETIRNQHDHDLMIEGMLNLYQSL